MSVYLNLSLVRTPKSLENKALLNTTVDFRTRLRFPRGVWGASSACACGVSPKTLSPSGVFAYCSNQQLGCYKKQKYAFTEPKTKKEPAHNKCQLPQYYSSPKNTSSISSNMMFAASTPPAVFHTASLTSCTLPAFATSRLLNRGSSNHSSLILVASPSPVS